MIRCLSSLKSMQLTDRGIIAPYILSNHEQYGLLPLCRKNGGEFLTIYQNEFTKQSNYSVSQKACFRTILTVNCSKDYYTSIDALIAEHEANGTVAHNFVRFVKWFQG